MNTNKIFTCLVVIFLMGNFLSKSMAQGKEGDSLSHYIQVAIENNPGLKAQKKAHEAYLEKIPQAGAIPDPEFSVEAFPAPMEIVGGRSIANIGLMQTFPWFGARKAAREEAAHDANVQQHQFYELVNELILDLSTRWYDMQKLREQLRNSEENKKLLQQLEQLALRMYSSPSRGSESGMSEVLRIQMEIAEIDNNIESIESQIKAEKARFNALLNREPSAEVIMGGRLQKEPFMLSDAEVLSAIATDNPTLVRITEEAEVFKAKSEKDRKMSYPTIGVGAQYMLIGKTNHPYTQMGSMNGKDMLMPMVSVSLPIFRNKYDAQQRESELWRSVSEETFNNTYNRLKGEYFSFKTRLENAARKIKLYEKQSDLAQTTYDLTVKEFVAGKSNLTNIIQVQRQLLDYRLKTAEAIADYNIMVASIRQLLAANK